MTIKKNKYFSKMEFDYIIILSVLFINIQLLTKYLMYCIY